MRTSEESFRISAGCVWCNDRAGGCMVCGAGRIGRADKIYLHIGCHESELDRVIECLNGHCDKLQGIHIVATPRTGLSWPGIDREKEPSRPPPSDLDRLREDLAQWEQHRTPYGEERALVLREEIRRYESSIEDLKALFDRQPPAKPARQRKKKPFILLD